MGNERRSKERITVFFLLVPFLTLALLRQQGPCEGEKTPKHDHCPSELADRGAEGPAHDCRSTRERRQSAEHPADAREGLPDVLGQLAECPICTVDGPVKAGEREQRQIGGGEREPQSEEGRVVGGREGGLLRDSVSFGFCIIADV